MDVGLGLRVIIPYLLYAVVTVAIATGGWGNPVNLAVFGLVYGHGVPILGPALILLNTGEYGRAAFWIPALVITWLLGHRRVALVMLLSFALGASLAVVTKYVVYVPRPTVALGIEPLVPNGQGSSYPSGHALIVGTGAYAALGLPLYLRIPFLLEAILVSYGRVYVGLHWPIDVVAGWLLAVGNVELVRALLTKWARAPALG